MTTLLLLLCWRAFFQALILRSGARIVSVLNAFLPSVSHLFPFDCIFKCFETFPFVSHRLAFCIES